MDLKTQTKAQLKELAKGLVENYEELSKSELVAALELVLPTEEVVEEVVPAPLIAEQLVAVVPDSKPIIVKEKKTKEVKEEIKVISPVVRKNWETYLNRYKLSAKEFLLRYPNHPEREIIKTLI